MDKDKALRTALAQWKMHAEMNEETACMQTYDVAECKLYRECVAATDQQKTAEPCGDDDGQIGYEPRSVRLSRELAEQPAAPTQIDAGELEKALTDVVDIQTEERLLLESIEVKAKEFGGVALEKYALRKKQFDQHNLIVDAARAHLSKLSVGGK